MRRARDRRDLDCLATLLRTDGGGETWAGRSTFISHQTRIPLHDLRAVSGDTVWAIRTLDCTQPGSCPDEVLITEDGGRTWRTTLTGSRALDLEAPSATEAWVAVPIAGTPSTAYQLQHTTDGGRSWNTTLSSTNFLHATRTGNALWILERDGAYCTASDCSEYALRHSSDAGVTWIGLGNPKGSASCTGGHLGRPSFSGGDLRTGVIPISVGGGAGFSTGGLLETHDGGRTWSCGTTPPNVTVAQAVMGIIVAVSNDRLTNTDSVWVRSTDGVWAPTLPDSRASPPRRSHLCGTHGAHDPWARRLQQVTICRGL